MTVQLTTMEEAWAKRERTWKEGHRLWQESDRLREEAKRLWNEGHQAVVTTAKALYGKNVQIDWVGRTVKIEP